MYPENPEGTQVAYHLGILRGSARVGYDIQDSAHSDPCILLIGVLRQRSFY